MRWVLVLGLLLNAVVLPLAAKRALFLHRLITSGRPAPDRLENLRGKIGQGLKSQVVEVLGQRKLLQWSVPGAAHFFVFWAFLVLGTVYVEAYGALFVDGWAIPVVGDWAVLGFLQDLIALLALAGVLTFALIRVRQSPQRLGRRSRFSGSHLGPAWFTLFMIVNVVWTMYLFRGASAAVGHLPYRSGAFVSIGVGRLLEPLGERVNEVLEAVGLLLHIGVMLAFLVFVLNSKHLHIFVAPLNVLFGRKPSALGEVKPLTSDGRPVLLDDVEDLDENARLGVGAIEDFSWKGLLDMATCTECGRCQSQCPAWNTEKPLSPKLLIMALRDHAFAKAPFLLADADERQRLMAGADSGRGPRGESGLAGAGLAGAGAAHAGGKGHGSASLAMELQRPLVGDTGEANAYLPEDGSAVIDHEVLWSCVTCGACVQQCPVDIEHVDHIVDMRRYQVLVESSFPSELNGLFRQLETKGNPWGMSQGSRMDWAKDLPFEVKQVGKDVESLDEVEWLFWVGCAGAYEDRAKRTTAAVAELLDMAGVSFAVLGNGETCTGDPARRAGNEFVFQQLAMQNADVFSRAGARKVVSTCAHCFNTLKNEYALFGVELEVVHHTQLLNRLVREGRLTPVAPSAGAPRRTITYHDPCYLGRHNQVYTPPRELLSVIPATDVVEMDRNSERSFCCGAGGARMWMEERIGERINVNRTTEAVGTGADQIAVGCPFCRVMLSDGLTLLQSEGGAREEVEVLDVAQLLLASVKDARRSDEPAGRTASELPNDAEADDTQYPLTVAHDEATPQETATASPSRRTAGATDPASPPIDPAPERPGPRAPERPAASPRAGGLVLPRLDLPRPSWADLDVELILEGDEVDISEFKARLKAELKAEVLAEVRAELEGALNSPTGTSEPVEATTPGSVAEPRATEVQPSAGAAPEQTAGGGAAAAPEPAPSTSGAPPRNTAAVASPSTPADDDDDDDDDDDGALLIGSL